MFKLCLKRAKECVLAALFCSLFLPLYGAHGEISKAIAYSEQKIAQGDFKEASDTLLEAYPYALGEEKTQIEFLIGIAALRAKDYATAEWVFRKILKNQPALPRVRLELALLYFETNKNDKAEYHFRLVQGSADLPPIVKQRVAYFLYQIRYRKKWDYYINLGIAPSTNINNASGSNYECIDYGGIPLCRQIESKRSSLGISGGAGVDYYHRLSTNLRWKTGLNGSLSDYATSKYDMYSAGVSTGPLYNYARGSAGIYAVGDRVWYSGKGLLYDYGVMFQGSYDIKPGISLGLGTVFKWQDFDAAGYDPYDGTDTMVMPSVFYAFSSKSYLIFKPSYGRIRTDYSSTGKDSLRYALGFGTELPLGISLYIEPAYSNNRAKGESWLVNHGSLDWERRAEEIYSISARLLSRQINILGFTPTLNYSYNKARSNAESGNYEKHTFEMGITNKF